MAAYSNGNNKMTISCSSSSSTDLIKQPSFGLVSSSCRSNLKEKQQQQQQNETADHSELRSDFVTSSCNAKQLASATLANSFSFNSYQDIICDSKALPYNEKEKSDTTKSRRRSSSSRSTFAATSIKSFDNNTNNKEQHYLIQSAAAQNDASSATTAACNNNTCDTSALAKLKNLKRVHEEEEEEVEPCLVSMATRQQRQLIRQSQLDNEEKASSYQQKNNIVQRDSNQATVASKTTGDTSHDRAKQMTHLRYGSIGAGSGKLIQIISHDSSKTKSFNSVANLNSNNKHFFPFCLATRSIEKNLVNNRENNNNNCISKQGSKEERMSQTIQSIHSLSMQLNRAASQSELNQANLPIISYHNQNNQHLQQQQHGHINHHHHHQQQPSIMSAYNNQSSYQTTNSSNSIEDLETITQLQQTTTTASAFSSSSSASSRLSRLVGKKAARVKEILLQNLGKADKTTDELFELYEENFYKQQAQALKLQKEFKSYLSALKLSQEADKSLNNCIQQSTGDYQSARHDLVCENLTQMEHLNEDLMEKLRGQVMLSINEYLTDFNELREKISKRKRKLIDYDSSKRVYETTLASVNKKRIQMQQRQQQMQTGLASASSVPSVSRSFKSAVFNFSTSGQAAAAAGLDGELGSSLPRSTVTDNNKSMLQNATNQLVDEARLLKLREQFNYCKIMYETINSELYEELPMVYEKKMKNLLMTLQNYFSLEAQFHLNAGKLFATASDVIDELPMSIHEQHQQHRNINSATTTTDIGDESNASTAATCKAPTTSGSSGVGSSRAGDSSMESSSSPDASSCNDLQINSEVVVAVEDEDEDDGDGDGDGENNCPQELAIDGNEILLSQSQDEPEKQHNEEHNEEEAKINSTGSGKEEYVQSIEEEHSVEGSSYQGCAIVVSEQQKTINSGEGVEVVVCNDKEIDCPDSGLNEMVTNNIEIDGTSSSEKTFLLTHDKAKDDDEVDVNVDDTMAEKETQLEANKKPIVDKLLYKVKTSYKYLAEDVDELCFEADETIQVIEFDETQEPEEGWLMGVREVNGQRGLFPANFTQPI